MNSVKEIDFNYSPYYENIAILGQQGEGKTNRARTILDTIPNIPRFIWSPQRPSENYGQYGTLIKNVEEIHGGGAFVWNGNFDHKTFLQICNKIFFSIQNMVFVVDDCHEQCTKQSIPEEFERIILSKRNDGISGIYISPFPNRVHNTILGSCQIIFAYRFNLQTQIEWMRDNFFGDEAWILIPKDKRKRGCFDSENDFTILPKHSVLYRKNTEENNQLLLGIS